MCVNLCKAPVQQFFTEELGMPLTMCAPAEVYVVLMSYTNPHLRRGYCSKCGRLLE